MKEITVILTAYRRPALLRPQVDAIRRQTVMPNAVWVWANEPTENMGAEMKTLPIDRVVSCSQNAHVHARFALAITAPTKYVAVFDDDSIPGHQWFANCLNTVESLPSILGSAGVRLVEGAYRSRELYGWHNPCDQVIEVDLVGHAWFLPTEYVRYLFAEPAVVGTNGEDIELSARAWRLGNVRTFCPAHSPRDRSNWGSLDGTKYGSDAVAVSRRTSHMDDRDRIVRAEMAAGWKPLFLRSREPSTAPATPTNVNQSSIAQTPLSKPKFPELDETAQVLHWIPTSVRRVLDIGYDLKALVSALRSRQPIQIESITWGEDAVQVSPEGVDHLQCVDPDSPLVLDSSNKWDCIFSSKLENLRNPLGLLRQMRSRLTSDGVFVARLPNTRHQCVLAALLEGRWISDSQGAGKAPIRFFTRREIEKLFFRAGYDVKRVAAQPGNGYREWVDRGTPREIRLGQLLVKGLPADETEEFYASSYWVLAHVASQSDYGLTSIIVPTHNQLPYTQQCIQSLRMQTDEPLELIVVDNGSTDGTVDFLRSLPNIKVIWNRENRGFPAAVNQGIGAATGRQILLLNNDCLLCTGWLRRMLDALQTGPNIGLVGPCSNFVRGEQQITVDYQDLSDLDGFAWEWAKRHEAILEDTDRLAGFCLLIRRELLDKIGFLDEQFGIGCFEDDDYCLRARKAGFRVVIARAAFVHHFGARTISSLGIDYAALMRQNQQLFESKWPNQQSEEVRNKRGSSQASSKASPPRLSLKVIPGRGLQLVRTEA